MCCSVVTDHNVAVVRGYLYLKRTSGFDILRETYATAPLGDLERHGIARHALRHLAVSCVSGAIVRDGQLVFGVAGGS